MDATLSINGSDISEGDIAELTSRLRHDINQDTDLTAKLLEAKSGSGLKGDAITIGQLVLFALSSGAVVALFQVLKAHIERKPTLRFEIEAAGGRKLKLEAEHLSPEQIAQTMQAVKQLCEEKKVRAKNLAPLHQSRKVYERKTLRNPDRQQQVPGRAGPRSAARRTTLIH